MRRGQMKLIPKSKVCRHGGREEGISIVAKVKGKEGVGEGKGGSAVADIKFLKIQRKRWCFCVATI